MRVLGRVERFGGKLQVQVRAVEPAEDADPAELTPVAPARRGRARRLLRVPRRGDLALRASRRSSTRSSATPRSAARCGRFPRPEPTGTTATRAASSSTRSASRRSAARPRSSIRACASDLLLAAALLHDVGRVRELGRGPAFRQTEEGRLLGHVHLGLRMIEERARDLDPAVARRAPARGRAATTTARLRRPPRPPSSTTRTSSTRRPRRAPSATTEHLVASLLALGGAALLGRRRLPRRARARRWRSSPCSPSRRPSGSPASCSGCWSRATLPRCRRAAPGGGARESRAWSGSARSTAASRSARWASSRRSRRRRRSCRSRSTRRRATTPGALQWLGIALVLAGIAALSREPSARRERGSRLGRRARARRGARASASSSSASTREPTRARRGRSSRHARRPSRSPPRPLRSSRDVAAPAAGRSCRCSSAIGIFDTGANVLVAFATHRGRGRDRRRAERPLPGRDGRARAWSCSASG